MDRIWEAARGEIDTEPSQMAEKAQFVYDNLRLKTLPVGVKFLKGKQELPEKARRPALFLKKRITMCQAMTMARNYGWQMGITAEDLVCVLASLAFGFTTGLDARKEMVDSFFESNYKSSLEKTRIEVDQMCFLDSGEYETLFICPLSKDPRAPGHRGPLWQPSPDIPNGAGDHV